MELFSISPEKYCQNPVCGEPSDEIDNDVSVVAGSRRWQSSLAVVACGCEKCAVSQEPAAEKQPAELVFRGDLSEEDWDDITSFPVPLELDIYGTSVNDEDLKKLKDVTFLVSLNIGACPNITDKGLETVSGLKSIRSLNLMNSRNITDAGMKFVSRMDALESLCLAACWQISDAGIAELQDLPNLKCLDLMYCKCVTPATSISVSKMEKLEVLIFMCWDSHEFTAMDLRRLGTLPALKKLGLNKCSGIPLETLARCLPLGKMELLSLTGYEPVSESEVEKLRAAWPECRIEIGK